MNKLKAFNLISDPSINSLFSLAPVEPKVYKTQPVRSMVRQRPYADPYSGGMEDEEYYDGDSVMSPWSVDERVKNILYDSTSYERPVSEICSWRGHPMTF